MSPENQPDESGTQIFRHQRRDLSGDSVEYGGDLGERISDHFARHVGPIEMVYHEIASLGIHLDVHHIAPARNRLYHTLFTTGMSYRPMNVPEGAEEYRYAELMVHLPGAWPVQQAAFRDEANYWPIRWLKQLARLPYECDTWLSHGHTVPNGDPPTPVARDTKFCCIWLMQPILLPPEARTLEIAPDRRICFWNMIPLYREEMEHKLIKGGASLQEALVTAGVPPTRAFIVDNQRPNACAKPKSRLPFFRR